MWILERRSVADSHWIEDGDVRLHPDLQNTAISEIQVLRRAQHTWPEIAALSGVAEKTARRIAAEDAVTSVDNDAERARRQVGPRSKAETYREVLVQALTTEPTVKSVELLHRAPLAG